MDVEFSLAQQLHGHASQAENPLLLLKFDRGHA